jgi:hypothetical protein
MTDSAPSPISESTGRQEFRSSTPCDSSHPVDYMTAHNAAGLTAQTPTSVLPPALAAIQPEESRFSLPGPYSIRTSVDRQCHNPSVPVFTSLRSSIAANPHYLGEPHHIFLRNPNGNTDKRSMVKPAPGTIPPGKWYAISCGSSVGIFLSW